MSKATGALSFGWSLLLAMPAHAQSQRLVGLWEEPCQRRRGDQQVAVVFRLRGITSFAGMVYFDGEEFGPIESGRLDGDSVTFRATNYPFRGGIQGRTLALTLVVPHGSAHEFSLTRTAADTTTLPASVRTAPPPSAGPAIARDIAPDSVYAAHAVPTDRAPSSLPCLRRGTLLLVGGGPGQDDINARFVQLAGGAAARIVVIPTAHTETEDRAAIAQFGEAAPRILGLPHVRVLHTVSRREADLEEFARPLRTATGVWIDGGEGSYLLNAYLGTRTERELLALLDRGGVIGGTSAGALVWGSRCMVYRAQPGARPAWKAKPENLLIGHMREPGFGVLQNVLISPHFTEFAEQPVLEKFLAAHPGLVAFGIDEATALEVHGDSCRALGRSNVSVFRGPGGKPLRVLKDGDRLDLRHLTTPYTTARPLARGGALPGRALSG